MNYEEINGPDVARIVDKVAQAVQGERITNLSIGCLIVSILAQKPSIEPVQLKEVVKSVSEYMMMQLFSDGYSGSIN